MGENRIAHAGQNEPSLAEPIRRALHTLADCLKGRSFSVCGRAERQGCGDSVEGAMRIMRRVLS